jgi:hypothetical protein
MPDEDDKISIGELRSAQTLDQMARAITQFEANSASESRAHLDAIRLFAVECGAVMDEAEWQVGADVAWALRRDSNARKLARQITRPLRQAADHMDLAARRVQACWRLLQKNLRAAGRPTPGRNGRRRDYQPNR